MPAGRRIHADLVNAERKGLTQEFVIVARPSAAIADCEDRRCANLFAKSADNIELRDSGGDDVDRMAGARDADVVSTYRENDLLRDIPQAALGHYTDGPER